jgi:hypothetical protein
MKEEMVKPVKVLNVARAFGKIGAQQRPKLRFVRRINQLHLIETVENFRCGYAHSRRPAAGNKLLYEVHHKLIVITPIAKRRLAAVTLFFLFEKACHSGMVLAGIQFFIIQQNGEFQFKVHHI